MTNCPLWFEEFKSALRLWTIKSLRIHMFIEVSQSVKYWTTFFLSTVTCGKQVHLCRYISHFYKSDSRFLSHFTPFLLQTNILKRLNHAQIAFSFPPRFPQPINLSFYFLLLSFMHFFLHSFIFNSSICLNFHSKLITSSIHTVFSYKTVSENQLHAEQYHCKAKLW